MACAGFLTLIWLVAVQAGALKAQIITPVFKQVKNGEARMLGMMAKRARGGMARFVVENRITEPSELKGFKVDGYRYMARHSSEEILEFHRKA